MKRQARRELVAALLQQRDFSSLADLAGRETGVGTLLLQFLFDPHDLLCWRAIEGLGQVARAHPQQVEKLIGRLLYMLNEDSGSTGWSAAAALGEIARCQLSVIREIVPMFCGFLEEAFSRPAMLWGVGRLAEVHPEVLEEVRPFIRACLEDAGPEVRGLAAWCLGSLGDAPAIPALERLAKDDGLFPLYEAGEMRQARVGELARKALERLGPGQGH